MSRLGVSAALIATSMLNGLAKAETLEEAEARMKREPSPERGPRYVGVDYGAEPGRSVTFDPRDAERIAAAQAKRERRALRQIAIEARSATADVKD